MTPPSPVSTPTPATAASGGRHGRLETWPAFYVLGYFLLTATLLWLIDGRMGEALLIGLIGVTVSSGMLVHALARQRRKGLGRKVSVAVVGLSLFLGAGVFGRQSFQIEGFFFYSAAGVFGGVIVHYLVAKIVGPIILGRGWCSWACWIWMVFDYLPWKRNTDRRAGWPAVRAWHFALSLCAVLLLVFGLGYDHGFTWKQTDGMWWFLAGCTAYWTVGIALAAALKDNRAFCKYVCPITVLLRAGNRVSLLKVAGSPGGCEQCHACDKICPMGVGISGFVARGTRVLDPECTLCQSCLAACPNGNLRLTLGVDFSRRVQAADSAR